MGWSSHAATRYVSPSGAHVPPFATWANAATNLQDAVNAAGLGDVVLATNGIYAPFVGFETRFMTGSNTPAPVLVTASGFQGAGNEGWRAFSSNAFWALPTNVLPQWVVYDSGVAGGVEVDSYQVICPHRATGDQGLSDWEIQVSDDGAGWTAIDVRSEELTENVHYYFATAQPATARYVRIYVTGVRDPVNGGTLRIALGHSLVVTSVNGAAETVIDAAGTPGVWLGTARLEGFQVVGARPYGVFQGDVRRCLVTNTLGTGISAARNVEACRVVNSTARGVSNVTRVADSIIENNTLGGVSQCLWIERCLIRGNGTDAVALNGGGVHLADQGGTVSACLILSNRAQYGGGIYLKASKAESCYVRGNQATIQGGGIYVPSLDGQVYNCTVVGNAAANGGGTYYGTIYNTIIQWNTAFNQGPYSNLPLPG